MTKVIESPRRRPISKRLRRAIRLIATEGLRQRDAAAKAGLAETYLSRALQRPDVIALKDEMIRAALSSAAVRASHRLGELVDAESEHVSFDASRHALAIAGYKPVEGPSVVVNNTMVMPGYVIDLYADEQRYPPPEDVTPRDAD